MKRYENPAINYYIEAYEDKCLKFNGKTRYEFIGFDNSDRVAEDVYVFRSVTWALNPEEAEAKMRAHVRNLEFVGALTPDWLQEIMVPILWVGAPRKIKMPEPHYT